MQKIMTFIQNDSGAVTVDWVVLTAAMVGFGLAVVTVVGGGVEDHSGELQAALVTANPTDSPFVGNNVDLNDSID